MRAFVLKLIKYKNRRFVRPGNYIDSAIELDSRTRPAIRFDDRTQVKTTVTERSRVMYRS